MSKLPVLFFIQGGGFNANSSPNLDGSGLIVASGYSMVVVTLNYRVGPYGFLTDGGNTGSNVTANNGLRDQRKALEWVQKYIARFGGDPGHVVLGGDSAGAGSIALHLAAYGGNDTGLFHAAAGDSVSFATVLTAEQSRYQYDNLADQLGCAAADEADVLACLRAAPAASIQAVNTNIPYPGGDQAPLYMWNPVVDDDMLSEVTYAAFESGRFVRVPLLAGADANDGTVFVPSTTSTQEQSDAFLQAQFPYLTPEQLAAVRELYPNPDADACPSSGCFWRQASNAYGEARYLCPSLFVAGMMANNGYAYRWDVEDAAQVAAGLGVPHTVEMYAFFGPENTGGSAPASYYPGGANANAVAVAQAYWTSFVRAFDPNAYTDGDGGAAEWEPAAGGVNGSMMMMVVGTGATTQMVRDEALMSRCAFW